MPICYTKYWHCHVQINCRQQTVVVGPPGVHARAAGDLHCPCCQANSSAHEGPLARCRACSLPIGGVCHPQSFCLPPAHLAGISGLLCRHPALGPVWQESRLPSTVYPWCSLPANVTWNILFLHLNSTISGQRADDTSKGQWAT